MGGSFDETFLCVCESSIVGHGPSSGQELRPSVSQSVGLGGWHDRGGWPGLGARAKLGDWCGSRVPDRKTKVNDEAGGSQTMKRVVVWLRPSKRPFLRPQSNSRPRCPHKRQPDREFREPRASRGREWKSCESRVESRRRVERSRRGESCWLLGAP